MTEMNKNEKNEDYCRIVVLHNIVLIKYMAVASIAMLTICITSASSVICTRPITAW